MGLMAGAGLLLAQEAAPVAKQPQPKSKQEVEALQAMFSAQDPDGRIAAAQNLITKFADTEFKALALQLIAMSYEQKGDADNMIVYSERVLEADPQNYASMLMISRALAQRTKEFDLDKEEKLGRAEKMAHQAQEALKTAVKPRPDITDDQWAEAKKDFNSQALESLGLIAMVRKKYDVAIKEFNAAIEGSSNPDPATMVRLGAVYNLAGKHDEAVAILDKVMALPEVHPQIKQIAQAERVRAMQAKGGAKPATPPPAEPAKPANP